MSQYHATKCMDSVQLEFYSRAYGLKVTDLHQGVVYGLLSDGTDNADLVNRFDYDGIWGTVMNRFLAQAIIGDDMTVYGQGGQTRGIISIKDAIRCIELAIKNPA